MKPNQAWGRRLSLWVFSFLLCLAPNVWAQATGTIEGRVLNATSGRYLNNVRVSVEGSTQETFTNEFGEYRLVGVPAGSVTLNVFFTGLDSQRITVDVQGGQIAQQDVTLTRGTIAETVVLDAFVVASERDTNAASIAANEQRFANNIKNVVSADAFGDVTEGNVGEFIKYLPGVSVEYVAADVRAISVRGFDSSLTAVSVDGGRMASASSGSSSRTFELEQVSINNVARIELVKVPTPDMPADAIGGSVNMISKSAFERKGAQLNYRAVLNFNHEEPYFWKKTPGPGRKETYKVLPGFDFDYTLPITPDFGIVVTGLSSNQFNEQHRSQMVWENAGTSTGATPANPYLRQYTLQDGPKNTFRNSASVKADWRIARNHLLSAGAQYNYYKAFFGNRNININAGNNGTSTPAGGTALTYGPDFTSGATGRGAVTMGGSWRHKIGATRAANLKYTFNDGTWEVIAAANTSTSKTWYRATERGNFSGYNLTLLMPVRVEFSDFSELGGIRPKNIRVLDNNGNEVDIHDISNYRLNNVSYNPLDARDTFYAANLSAKRSLHALSFPASVKVGADYREQLRDIRRINGTINYVGPDGIAANADNIATRFLDPSYSKQDPHFNFPKVQWPNPYEMWNLYQSNPAYFAQTDAQAGTEETNRINGSEYLQEIVTSYFFQFEGRLLENRLGFVTGVRYERTEDRGRGPLFEPDNVFLRNPDGSYVRNASGARVRKPEAGVAGSLAEALLTRTERGFTARRAYDYFFPSLNANYAVTPDLVVRFAYAQTYNRPNFDTIIPNTNVNENEQAELDPSVLPGTITVRNTGLKPWTADNYDLSLEYYTRSGGTFTAGVMHKEIENFFGSRVTIADPAALAELGLDPRYIGWQLSTTINTGDASISGVEFSARQSLDFLDGWGRHFAVFANGTKLRLRGSSEASFSNYIPETANWGFDFNKDRFSAKIKWNYRGEQRRGQQNAFGPNGREFYTSRVNLDVNFEYRYSKRLTFFANARNLLNEPQTLVRYGDNTPDYARFYQQEEFGVQTSVGVKGTW